MAEIALQNGDMNELEVRRLSEEIKALKVWVNELSISEDFFKGWDKPVQFYSSLPSFASQDYTEY